MKSEFGVLPKPWDYDLMLMIAKEIPSIRSRSVSRYREQYDRVRRRLARFSEVDAEVSTAVSLIDDALAFFESCLHLRDWIANDKELPPTIRRAVRCYVKTSSVLRVCHDIAIGAKHLTVERPLAKEENPHLRSIRTLEQRPADLVYEEEDNFLPPGHLVHVVSVRLMLEMDTGEAEDAVAFATRCVKEWDSFFELHGLT